MTLLTLGAPNPCADLKMSKLLLLLLVASFRDASSCDCETLSFTTTGYTGGLEFWAGLYTKMPGVTQNGRPVWSNDGEYYVYYHGMRARSRQVPTNGACAAQREKEKISHLYLWALSISQTSS